MEDNKLFTLLVYSENVAGILNQITAVFTRRQVNIESLNVSASSIPGVHKYTITAWSSDEDQIVKIVRQIEKKIDVVKANYFTDDQPSFFMRSRCSRAICLLRKRDIYSLCSYAIYAHFVRVRYDINPLTPSGISRRQAYRKRRRRSYIANPARDLYRAPKEHYSAFFNLSSTFVPSISSPVALTCSTALMP